MLKSEKRLAELKNLLVNGKYNEIHDRISMLRSEEPFEGALRTLALFYDNTGDERLRLLIASFFNDLKEKSGRAEVISSIKAVRNPASRAMLASSCWQSGLDYSEYAVDLAMAFSEGDYMTALECFTAIEGCTESLSDDGRKAIIKNLQREISGFDSPKQMLARELITLLRG